MITKFKMLAVLMVGVLWFSSCSKVDTLPTPIDENYWLQKERGIVVYSDFSCDHYIVETRQGYSVVRNWGGFAPRVGEWLYGDFNRWGTSDIYNRSAGIIITGNVREYWLTWFAARDAVAFQCGR